MHPWQCFLDAAAGARFDPIAFSVTRTSICPAAFWTSSRCPSLDAASCVFNDSLSLVCSLVRRLGVTRQSSTRTGPRPCLGSMCPTTEFRKTSSDTVAAALCCSISFSALREGDPCGAVSIHSSSIACLRRLDRPRCRFPFLQLAVSRVVTPAGRHHLACKRRTTRLRQPQILAAAATVQCSRQMGSGGPQSGRRCFPRCALGKKPQSAASAARTFYLWTAVSECSMKAPLRAKSNGYLACAGLCVIESTTAGAVHTEQRAREA